MHKAELPVDPLLVPWLAAACGSAAGSSANASAACLLGRVEEAAYRASASSSRRPRKQQLQSSRESIAGGSEGPREQEGEEASEALGGDLGELLRVRYLPQAESSIFIIGTENAVRRAKALAPTFVRRQLQIKAWEDAVRLREQALEERQKQGRSYQATPPRFERRIEAKVGQELGRILGRRGANLQGIQDKYNVSVMVGHSQSGEDMRSIVVAGDDEAAVEKAIRDAEVVEEMFELSPEMLSLISGRRFDDIQELAESVNLKSFHVNRSTRQLLFAGTRAVCAQAKELFRGYFLYQPVFKELDAQLAEVMAEVDAAR